MTTTWTSPRKRDLFAFEAELRRRIEQTGWWITQLLPDVTGDGRWICVIAQEDTGLKLAYTHQERHEALRLAVEAAEGRQGRG
jgi:hypothetical protein